MTGAIGIKAQKAPEGYDLGASKLFGTPTVPSSWEDTFDEDEIFFCQIRLSEIAALDTENALPHTGYLYIFLHTAEGEYHLSPDVRYSEGEPTLAYDGFNAAVEGYERYTEAYLLSFERTEKDADGTKLLGTPSGWSARDAHAPLFFQYDPLADDTGFLSHIDGYLYFFFGKDTRDLTSVTLTTEYS